jgi:uncharacterized protein YegL
LQTTFKEHIPMSSSTGNRPGSGEETGGLPLQFIWIADCSSSMLHDAKIQALNFAIAEALPIVRDIVDDQHGVKVFMRALRFSDGAKWHVEQPTDVHSFRWEPLVADGCTDMGAAFNELAKVLQVGVMPTRGLPPVLVLLTDGQPTDSWEKSLAELLDVPWAKKAVKIGIGIGADADMAVLQKFMGNTEAKPLSAGNVKDLVNKIRWAATSIRAASDPKVSTSADDASAGKVQLQPAPEDIPADPGTAVW